MTQRVRFKLLRMMYTILAVSIFIGALIMTTIGNAAGYSILSYFILMFGVYFITKHYDISSIEYTLKSEILLEDFLDRMIKAKNKNREEFKLDRELKEFIDSLDQVEFQKLLRKLGQ